MQIDHLIPRSYKHRPKALDELLRECLAPEDYGIEFVIDAPHNLAPICQGCNGRKSDKPFGKIPVFMDLLKRARKREPEVAKRFLAFYARNALAKALLIVTVAEVDEPKAQETLKQFGPLMVNRLRTVSPDILETPSTYEYDYPQLGEMHQVIVTLDKSGRRAKVVLEDVYDCDFDKALRNPLRAVIAAINQHFLSEMRQVFFEGGESDPEIADPVGRIFVEVSEISYVSADEFRLGGNFEADGTSEAAIHANTDSGTAWVEADATAMGTFSVFFASDNEPLDAESVDLKISDGEARCDDPVWKENSNYYDDWPDEPDEPDEPGEEG
jgi:hypothetical protein